MKIIKPALIILLCIFLIECIGTNMNKKQIEKLINQNLKPGDSESKIVIFFESQGWLYEYDKYSERFQAKSPGTLTNYFIFEKGIQIYIYLDENMLFKKAEVIEVYSSL